MKVLRCRKSSGETVILGPLGVGGGLQDKPVAVNWIVNRQVGLTISIVIRWHWGSSGEAVVLSPWGIG